MTVRLGPVAGEVVDDHVHRFSADEFHSLATLTRVELLDGVVYDVAPKNDARIIAMNALIKAFKKLDDAFVLQVQDPVRLAGWDGPHAPEVDLAIFKDTVPATVPAVDDAVAFIEVADSTYPYDRDRKVPLYVACGVSAWIVNIQKRWVEAYQNAADLELPNGTTHTEGRITIAGVSIEVARLFASDVSTP